VTDLREARAGRVTGFGEAERERQSRTMNYSLVGFPKTGDKKAEDFGDEPDEEASEAVEAVEPEDAKEVG
jgi:hypothetical protein